MFLSDSTGVLLESFEYRTKKYGQSFLLSPRLWICPLSLLARG